MEPWEAGGWQATCGLQLWIFWIFWIFSKVFWIRWWPFFGLFGFFGFAYGFLLICWRVPGVVAGWVPCSIAGWSHAENTRERSRVAQSSREQLKSIRHFALWCWRVEDISSRGVLSTPSPPRIHTYIVTIEMRKHVTFCCDIDELRTHHIGEDFPHRVRKHLL